MNVQQKRQDSQCTYNVTFRCNHRCSGKPVSITYSEFVSVALVILHAPHCHLWPALLYNIFPHYHTKGKIFEIKLLNTKCVF